MQPALTAVQLALAGSPLPDPVRRPAARAPASVFGAIRAQSWPAKGMAVAALALVFVVGVQQVSTARAAERAAAFDLAVGRQAEYMTAMLLEQRRYEKDSILNMSDPAEIEAYANQWEKARVAMQTSLDTLGAANLADEDRQSLTAIRDDSRTYEQGYLQVLAQMRQGHVRSPQEANRMLEAYKPAAHRAEVNGVLLATRAMQRLHQ
jgi:methyl-accepting chemotaxis protein